MGHTPKIQVSVYNMSVHWGLCCNVDSLEGAYCAGKKMWEGDSGNAVTTINIYEPNLFGGDEKEGGVQGQMIVMPGNDGQTAPGELLYNLGRNADTVPAFLGVCSVFFCQAGKGQPYGFNWSCNNPYLKDVWFRVKRAPKTPLDQEYLHIGTAKSVSVRGHTVTVDGITGTCEEGMSTSIGDSLVKIDGTSVTVDGIVIAYDLANNEVSVGGIGTQIVDTDTDDYQKFLTKLEKYFNTGSGAGSVTVNGATVTFISSYYDTIQGTQYQLANIDIRFNAAEDVNPVHVIFEAMTNSVWGMGEDTTNFDMDSWNAAARTVFNEGYGVSMRWSTQDTIESFVTGVLGHIEGNVSVNPLTGLWEIILTRGDYDTESLPVFDQSMCVITDFDRKLFGETVNELVVSYTNPSNETEATVTVQNLANIAIQGTVVSQTRSHSGFRNPAIALKAALRDLRTMSAPLATIEIQVNRSAWNLLPGQVLKLNYPEDGYDLDGLVCRILTVNYGTTGTPYVTIQLIEDIFSLPVGGFGPQAKTEWTPPQSHPAPLADTMVITAPFYFLAEGGELVGGTFEYPDSLAMVFAETGNSDTFSFDLWEQVLQANGSTDWQKTGSMALVGKAALTTALTAQPVTTETNFGNFVGALGPDVNVFAFIGTTESTCEIALISASDEGGYTLQRGVCDTIPRNWPAGTTVWFASPESAIFDSTPRIAGEQMQAKMLTVTSLGTLALADAPEVYYTMLDRPWLPLRPANVTVAGTSFQMVDLSTSSATTVTVTWANRNRLVEPTQVSLWTDPNTSPEDGQTTRIDLLSSDLSVIHSYTGLTGTSFAVMLSDFGGVSKGFIRVLSERDGLQSFMSVDTPIILPAKIGYGNNYGNNYGK